MAGTTLKQRLSGGKGLAPLANGLIPWGRQSDGVEFVCTFQQAATLLATLMTGTYTAKAANYTATAADAFTTIEFSTGSRFTLPTDAATPSMPDNAVINVVFLAAGGSWPTAATGSTVVGGVTYVIPAGLGTPAQNMTYSWRHRSPANTWILA